MRSITVLALVTLVTFTQGAPLHQFLWQIGSKVTTGAATAAQVAGQAAAGTKTAAEGAVAASGQVAEKAAAGPKAVGKAAVAVAGQVAGKVTGKESGDGSLGGLGGGLGDGLGGGSGDAGVNFDGSGFLAEGLKDVNPQASKCLKHVGETNQITSSDQALDVFLTATQANRALLNKWINGVGDYYASMVIASARIVNCVDGVQSGGLNLGVTGDKKKSTAKVCNKDYGQEWGWEPYNGGFDSVKTVITQHQINEGSAKYKEQLSASDLRGRAKIIAQAILNTANLFERKDNAWTKKDLGYVMSQGVVILGSHAAAYHPELAPYVVQEYTNLGANPKSAPSGLDLGDYQTDITKSISLDSETDNQSFNGITRCSDETFYGTNNKDISLTGDTDSANAGQSRGDVNINGSGDDQNAKVGINSDGTDTGVDTGSKTDGKNAKIGITAPKGGNTESDTNTNVGSDGDNTKIGINGDKTGTGLNTGSNVGDKNGKIGITGSSDSGNGDNISLNGTGSTTGDAIDKIGSNTGGENGKIGVTGSKGSETASSTAVNVSSDGKDAKIGANGDNTGTDGKVGITGSKDGDSEANLNVDGSGTQEKNGKIGINNNNSGTDLKTGSNIDSKNAKIGVTGGNNGETKTSVSGNTDTQNSGKTEIGTGGSNASLNSGGNVLTPQSDDSNTSGQIDLSDAAVLSPSAFERAIAFGQDNSGIDSANDSNGSEGDGTDSNANLRSNGLNIDASNDGSSQIDASGAGTYSLESEIEHNTAQEVSKSVSTVQTQRSRSISSQSSLTRNVSL